MPTTPNLALPYPASTDVGDVPASMLALATALDTLLGSASTAYTPTWTGTGVSLGNGTVTGGFRKVGKWVRGLWIIFTPGSTTNFGSAGATWSFTLPPAVTAVAREQSLLMKAYTGTEIYQGLGIIAASSATIQCYAPTSSTDNRLRLADNTHPGTWTSAGNLGIYGDFEST